MRLTSFGPAVQTAAAEARPVPQLRMSSWLALLTAFAGGLALAAAFPPMAFWPLAVLGPALLAIALRGQRLRMALAAGLVFGLAFFYLLLSWEINLAWYVWAALATGEAVIFAVLTIGQWLMLRLRAWPLAVAGWWVAAEALRDRWPWGGFPWGRLAMSQAHSPAVRWVAMAGPPFLSFMLALIGACLAWLLLGSAKSSEGPFGLALHHPDRGKQPWFAATALVAIVAVVLCGPLLPVDRGSAGQPTAVVAAIQGNVPHAKNLPDLWRATKVTQNHATATLRLAARTQRGGAPVPDLVIWPENSTDQDPRLNLAIYETIANAVDAMGRPVLVGAVLQNPVRNAGQLWLPNKGPVADYIKRKLVPFGEVIPFRSLLAKITNLPSSLQPVNFTPGHRAVVFKVGKIRLGDVICYEVSFDGLVASEVNGGANLLAVQTNDADFEIDGQLGETEQQLAMARIRAVEYNRSVVVASTTGISAIIGPNGNLLVSTKTWRQAEIEARVPLRSSMTLADRLGGWPEALIVWTTVAALAWTITIVVRQRRRRDRPSADSAAQ